MKQSLNHGRRTERVGRDRSHHSAERAVEISAMLGTTHSIKHENRKVVSEAGGQSGLPTDHFETFQHSPQEVTLHVSCAHSGWQPRRGIKGDY